MLVQTRNNYIYNYQYEYHYEDSDGDHRYDKHIDTRNQKIENYYLDIKLGSEKALSSKFTGRIGGEIVKLLSAKNTTEEENVYLYNSSDSYYGNDSSNEYSKTTTTIDSENTTPQVSFTAGLAYQLCKAITLEYTYVSAYLPFEFTTTRYSSLVGGDAHQVSATLRF